MRRATRWFRTKHDIVFKKILSDNGKEFTTHWPAGREHHSFEKELKRLNIKHVYTKPYRPQTNGKVEAFWKIIKREFLTRYFFKDWREFNLKLHQYMYYYNNERRHGGINYLTPIQKLLKSELEISPEENFKSRSGEKRRSAGSRTVGQSIIINSNHFVTEVVR